METGKKLPGRITDLANDICKNPDAYLNNPKILEQTQQTFSKFLGTANHTTPFFSRTPPEIIDAVKILWVNNPHFSSKNIIDLDASIEGVDSALPRHYYSQNSSTQNPEGLQSKPQIFTGLQDLAKTRSMQVVAIQRMFQDMIEHHIPGGTAKRMLVPGKDFRGESFSFDGGIYSLMHNTGTAQQAQYIFSIHPQSIFFKTRESVHKSDVYFVIGVCSNDLQSTEIQLPFKVPPFGHKYYNSDDSGSRIANEIDQCADGIFYNEDLRRIVAVTRMSNFSELEFPWKYIPTGMFCRVERADIAPQT